MKITSTWQRGEAGFRFLDLVLRSKQTKYSRYFDGCQQTILTGHEQKSIVHLRQFVVKLHDWQLIKEREQVAPLTRIQTNVGDI